MTNLTNDQIFLLYLNDCRAQLLYYTCTYVIPVGIALNILSSIVFMRKKFAKRTMGFYNIAISIFNILFALFSMLSFIGISYGNDLTLISDFSCIFLAFALRVFAQMSSWMNVFVTVDRIVFLKYPNKYPLLQNKKMLSVLIFIQFIILCIINAPNFFLKVHSISSTDPLTNTNITTKSCTSTETIVTVRDMIMAVFKVALPIVLMTLMNMYLIKKIIKEKSKVSDALKKEYQFAFSIFFMNALYTLLLLPAFFILVYLNITQYGHGQQLSITLNKEVLIWQFAYGVALAIVSYEFLFTFFVNIFFNKMFKKELVVFLKQILLLQYKHPTSLQINEI